MEVFPNQPLLLKNRIDDWEILYYKERDWCEIFGDDILTFRKGRKKYTECPYWEQLCEKQELTLKQFFEVSSKDPETWLYFDYKYLKNILPKSNKLYNEIKWNNLNLTNFSGQDSTFWIGNCGAHTPCHMDTYGCNFVAQIFGRKLWILIPPEEAEVLNFTRVPYEESSVFSSYNFYTPNKNLLKVKQAFKIILSPGDVLYVPRHWWHYVENLEVAISLNIWIPLDADDESRLEEALVRHYIFNVCKSLPECETKQLLNPNEYDLLSETNTLDIIRKCVENCIKKRNGLKENNIYEIHKIFSNVQPLQAYNMESFINRKINLFNYTPTICEDKKISENIELTKTLINAYANFKNLNFLKEKLIKHFQ